MTCDYLYLLSLLDGKLINYLDRPTYRELAVSLLGDCTMAEYYYIEIVDKELNSIHNVDTPIPLDMISFRYWQDSDLVVEADEFCNWNNHVKLLLDAESLEVTIISETKRGPSM